MDAGIDMSRTLRIAILLLVLAFVGLGAWTSRVRLASWDGTHWVAVYPIDAAESAAVDAYIERLRAQDLAPLERYFARWGRRYDDTIERPVAFKLAPRVDAIPPAPPAGGNIVATAWWSLRMRYWAWRNDTFDGPADVQVFVAYHDPATRARLDRSLGLRKAGIGVVHGFGAPDYTGRNNVVIAHEFLHVAGATDKYDPATGRPLHPVGYADPDRVPLHPQDRAEIMGATIARSPHETIMPDALEATVVGPVTAAEIGWTGTH